MSPFYDVLVTRTETWTETARVEAKNAKAAEADVEEKLKEGWDAVFPTNPDGEYCTCDSEVTSVTPVKK